MQQQSRTASGSELAVRPAAAEDAGPIAKLLGALGYEATAVEVEARLARLLASPDRGVLIAEAAGEAVAVASFQVIELLERPHPQCRITALVTDEDHRRRGAASALIEAIESEARRRGCFRLEVTTRPEREEAAAFYEDLGFTERPRRLVKYLR